MRYERLFEPILIGRMELKNRIVMPGMTVNLSNEGYVTERDLAYFEARARGGTGLIVIGAVSIDFPTGRMQIGQSCLDDDKYISGMSQLAQTIRKHGARAAVQLHHGGRSVRPQFVPVPVGPSAIARPGRPMPRELTVGEIADIVARFGKAAKRAREAGFDGVEIHAAHGYLIANFLSADCNRRQDAYGGELKNRARLLLEIIGAIREAVGKTYPVWCKINGKEYGTEHGITLEESKQLARMVEQAGVDAIGISAMGDNEYAANGPLVHFPGHLVPLAADVKKVVNIPVMTVGRISPDLAEKVLREKKADLVAIGRPLIADPDLPNKLASGRANDIRPCLYCSMCVHHISTLLESLRCTVNAAAGREYEFRIAPVEKTRNVLVVGGGPGGMEAARVAAQRGHQVTLYEKGFRLGGGLNIVGILNPEIEKLSKYLISQLKMTEARIILEQEVTPKLIESTKPDVVILAVGASLVAPAIPGIERDNVISGDDIRRVMGGHFSKRMAKGILSPLAPFILRRFYRPSFIRRLTRLWLPLGRRVVIIGGDRIGCETAEFLAERGRQVTIVDNREGMIGDGIQRYIRDYLIYKLRELGVTMLDGVKYGEITDKGLTITTKAGVRQTIEAETIVLATDAQPNSELSVALKGIVPEVYLVGDGLEPRGILEAIGSASDVARVI